MPNAFKDWARMYGANKLSPPPPGSTPGPGEPGARQI